jgi:hypothetical protein
MSKTLEILGLLMSNQAIRPLRGVRNTYVRISSQATAGLVNVGRLTNSIPEKAKESFVRAISQSRLQSLQQP